jgi:sugar/nucleoside kinase (ribokinase family)
VTKPSADDARRVFGPGYEPEQYIEMFHDLSAETVIFTMGDEGNLISENGRITGHVPARPVEVVDATGAGDAFWSAFLMAQLDGKDWPVAVNFAHEVASLKLRVDGHVERMIDRESLYSGLKSAGQQVT